MLQDPNGTHTREKYDLDPGDVIRTYRNVDNIPAFGFSYSGYDCANGSTIEIDPETGKVKVASSQKDICYVYYDGTLQNADIIVNVFTQKVVGGEYIKVNSVPTSKKYKINTDRSLCKRQDETQSLSDIKPTYASGFVELPETNEKLICDAYLDIDNG